MYFSYFFFLISGMQLQFSSLKAFFFFYISFMKYEYDLEEIQILPICSENTWICWQMYVSTLWELSMHWW